MDKSGLYEKIARLIGSLNLAFAALGLYSLMANLIGFFLAPRTLTLRGDLIHRVFFTTQTIVGCLMVLLACAGIQILRGNFNSGVLISNPIFGAEIFGFALLWVTRNLIFTQVMETWLFGDIINLAIIGSNPSPRPHGEFWALLLVSNLGCLIQVLTAYPVTGLVALDLAWWKMKGKYALPEVPH